MSTLVAANTGNFIFRKYSMISGLQSLCMAIFTGPSQTITSEDCSWEGKCWHLFREQPKMELSPRHRIPHCGTLIEVSLHPNPNKNVFKDSFAGSCRCGLLQEISILIAS